MKTLLRQTMVCIYFFRDFFASVAQSAEQNAVITINFSISGLMVKFLLAKQVPRVRFPADANILYIIGTFRSQVRILSGARKIFYVFLSYIKYFYIVRVLFFLDFLDFFLVLPPVVLLFEDFVWIMDTSPSIGGNFINVASVSFTS